MVRISQDLKDILGIFSAGGCGCALLVALVGGGLAFVVWIVRLAWTAGGGG